MSLACKCDKCRKFYERDESFNKRKYKLCARNNLEMDLCKECYSELEEWFTKCIQVRDCLHCKYSKNDKINSTETCHECMWENQFEKDDSEESEEENEETEDNNSTGDE